MSELQGAIEGQTGQIGNVKIDGVVDRRQGSELDVEYTSRMSRFKLTPKSRYGRPSTWEEFPAMMIG